MNWRRPTRRVLELVPEGRVWHELTEVEQIAILALDRHLRSRFEQKDYEPFESVGEFRDCIFLTAAYVQRLLRELRYRKKGVKFAYEIIDMLGTLGVIEDTKLVRKPRRSAQDVAAAEKFTPGAESQGDIATEGGKDAQPSELRSYWYRVFRVPVLSSIMSALRPLGAYDSGRIPGIPQALASLSALLKSQGLIPRRKRRSRPRRGSAQWVFLHSGPP